MDSILITGGNGFIGRHLVKKLSAHKPLSITLISNKSNLSEKYFMDTDLSTETKLNCHVCDIRDRDQISEIFLKERPQTCIHLAAKTSVVESINNPYETMEINVKGTLNVLSASYSSKVKNFILASSAAVYGNVKQLPISEKQDLHPLSPYGTSKVLAEEYVSLYKKLRKIQNAIILRIFNVYGTGQSSETDVITRFVARLSKGLRPIIYGNGLHTRDFISVDDVVRAILLCVTLKSEVLSSDNYSSDSSMVVNIGTGIPTSTAQLAEKLIKIFGLDLEPIYNQETVDNKVILHSYADTTKARNVLKFVPKKAIDEGLKDMIEQMQLAK